MQKWYKITLVLFLYVPTLFCQLQVKNFFALTGKKNVPVQVLLQAYDGILWLGTSDGLYRFDGRKAISLSKEYPTLRQDITALFTDETETTWIGTRLGKVYTLFKNKLDSLPLSSNPEDLKAITTFYQLSTQMWIGTYGAGIYVCDRSGEIRHVDSQKDLSDNVIYTIAGDKKNTLWCGTDAGITQINVNGPDLSFKIISNKDGLPDNIVRNISVANNKLLIAMQDSGICYYDLSQQRIERNGFFTNWKHGTILNVIQEAEDKLIIGTEKNGLLIFEKGTLSAYDYQKYVQSGSINQLMMDREKQLWMASKNGISQFIEKRYSFITTGKGLRTNEILALAIDNNKGIWLGTSMGISKIVTDEEGKLFITDITGLKKHTISCAAKAPDGNIWFGTYGSGIIVISPETNNSVILNSEDEKLADDNISNIYFADKNTLYISTLGGGLIKARVELEGTYKLFQIEKTYTEAEGLGSNYVYAAITDSNSTLYVATDGGGLQVLEGTKFMNLTKRYHLASSTVFSLCRDQNNNIWATSNANGIIKYNGTSIQSLKAGDGLRDEEPQQLVSTGKTVYAINSKGIDKIDCATSALSYYDLFDGDLEPNLNAVFLSDNIIYSGTNNGLLIYRTVHEHSDSIKPIVVLKTLQLNYKDFPLDSLYEIKYDQNNLSFTFDGIWLKNPEKLLFRYRLSWLEPNWIYVNEGKTINYNNLGPGNYTFMVQVKNEEDIWSEPVGYSFIINTPVWKRWWFWLLVLGFLSVSVYALIRYRLKALQRENVILERRVKERTYQIERQSEIIESKNKELEQLSLVASKTDNVVLILDANGKLEYVNESFTKLHNMDLASLKVKYGETIFELSNNGSIREIIRDAVSNKRSVAYESLNKKIENGPEIWESSTLTPLFDETGALKKIIIIDTNVTERKKQEQIIFQKNKDITDSISYARKIQHAILPHNSVIKAHLPLSFVLYMTKDIVSGDFYWFSHLDAYSIIAAVDCTGHGVPGAFMSLIGYNLLNKIVNEEKTTDPSEILAALNQGVLDALYKNESESKDGMDIAICKINHRENTLEYAGAMRPLWIINNGELTEIKADKIPIGTRQSERTDPILYTRHRLEIRPGDFFYIFTDGYADQFGGPKDKKYSSAKFKQLLVAHSNDAPSLQEQRIKLEHHAWRGEHEQVDDILIIGFKVG